MVQLIGCRLALSARLCNYGVAGIVRGVSLEVVLVIRRRVVVPAGVERLWRALTDPEEASQWLGGRVEWTPAEGEPLRFSPTGPNGHGGAAGDAREGRVQEVVPHRYMRFVWWPADGDTGDVTEVAYSLEPVVPGGGAGWSGAEGGEAETILTVEEVPVAAPAASAQVGSAQVGSAQVGSPQVGSAFIPSGCVTAAVGPAVWTAEDDMQWRVWAARDVACVLAR